MNDVARNSAAVEGSHPLLPHAVALQKEGRLEEAAAIYRTILTEHPRDFDATHLLGVIALQQGDHQSAQQVISIALAINPNDVTAMCNLGISYMRDGQLESALKWFDIGLQLRPDYDVALTNCGTCLHNMGRDREAIPKLRKALAAKPESYGIYNLLGVSLLKVGDVHEAVEVLQSATRLLPDNAEAWANLSVALNAAGDDHQARECANRAVELKPQSASALGALGAAQFDQGKLAEAIESYRKGIAIAAPTATMLLTYGHALMASGLNDDGIQQLEQALVLDQNNLSARWAIAIASLKPIYANESDSESSRRKFSESVESVAAWRRSTPAVTDPFNAVGVSQPFYIAYQPCNNRELLSKYGAVCSEWMATLPLTDVPRGPAAALDRSMTAAGNRRIRVGIAAAHIHEHSVWNAITRGWVHHLDRNKFEIFIFQLNPTSDRETEAARKIVTHIEARPASLPEWASVIAKCRLDVLIYPEIGMDPLTVRLAALRLAPIQAASWGHPETTGLPTMDLYLTGDGLEPHNAADNYSEKPIRLANLGVYVEPLTPKLSKPGIAALNLPTNEPLLLCPGSPFKYSPAYDEVWVQIAQGLRKKTFWNSSSGGRLVFFRSRSTSMDQMLETRLRAAFERAGVSFDAFVSIIPTLDRSRFFGLMRHSAVLLDTIGFSGFNTAIQAIECSLPVLAFEGEFMRGRLASAIMRRLDMPELIAVSREDYVRKAIAIAGDAALRRSFRGKIEKRRSILFHDLAPVRDLETHLIAAVMAAETRATTATS